MKVLGEQFDIHTGGEDHIPIHHTNEIAQAEAATGKKFVNYWMHENFLTFKGEKVSKSKGGLYTIKELEDFDNITIQFFRDNPEWILTGVGFGNIDRIASSRRYVNPNWYYAEVAAWSPKSDFLNVFASGGIVLTVLMIFKL